MTRPRARLLLMCVLAACLASCAQPAYRASVSEGAPSDGGGSQGYPELWAGRTPTASGSLERSRLQTVRVRRGDTLYAIAKRERIALRTLIDVNDLRPPYALEPGQVLKTPGGVRYAVARGDTLYGIAQRFGVEVADLRLVNGLGSDNAIDAGERLVLPRTDAPERLRTASSQSGSPAASADGPASPEPRPVLKAERRAAPPPPPRSSETFDWPVTGPLLAEFGETADGLQNDGIKIGVPAGTPVRAAESGVVVYAGDDLVGLGKLVLVQHGDGWLTAYAHLDRIDVGDGAQIGRGDTIGLAGATGSVGSAQLHFETRRGERPVNPLEHLPPRTV